MTACATVMMLTVLGLGQGRELAEPARPEYQPPSAPRDEATFGPLYREVRECDSRAGKHADRLYPQPPLPASGEGRRAWLESEDERLKKWTAAHDEELRRLLGQLAAREPRPGRGTGGYPGRGRHPGLVRGVPQAASLQEKRGPDPGRAVGSPWAPEVRARVYEGRTRGGGRPGWRTAAGGAARRSGKEGRGPREGQPTGPVQAPPGPGPGEDQSLRGVGYYREVLKEYPNPPEAKQAEQRAKALQKKTP